MRNGFTTGSCAAAASKAAAFMLLLGIDKDQISIMTPKGIRYDAKILDINKSDSAVSCAVAKDAGDDIDATDKALIYSSVSIKSKGSESENAKVFIDGGFGVGRVTKPGLDQPIGNAAINHVPREMIEKEVKEVCQLADFHGEISVIISVPEGEEIAKKTFNPRLGIVGGISILGTSGVVEPMSVQAIVDTIKVELKMHRAQGETCAAVSPGNYGRDYMQSTYGYDLDKSVKCSNFVGQTIDLAAELGFESMLLTGNLGKLIKVAGGIMNTHSREADSRFEIIAAAAILEDVPVQVVKKILDCVMTDEAVDLLAQCGKLEPVMKRIMDKTMFYLRKRANDRLEIECIIYSSKYGELAKSEGADKWLTLLVQDQEQQI